MTFSFPLTGSTQVLGIIGDPVEHSLSPVMQNAAIAHLGLDFIYVPFPVQGVDLPAALAGFRATGVRGVNVTIPHKQRIMPLLDQITPVAEAVGSVNTVWRTESGWQGTNTDVQGLVSPLVQYPGLRAVILGCGGAARAAVAGCHQLGFESIGIVGRNPEKLQHFLDSWQSTDCFESLSMIPWDTPPHLAGVDLVVNTTPLGMFPHTEQSPLTPEALAQLPDSAIVYDLIYRPAPTLLLRQAQERGLQTLDGTEMLVQQGAAALEIWTQQQPPVAVMRSALLRYLEQEPSHP